MTITPSQFSYATWDASTVVKLMNVPWNSDYRDIVRFPLGKAGLNSYLDSITEAVTQEKLSFAKPTAPITLEIPFNVASQFNYLRAKNEAVPGGKDFKKDYYYFISNPVFVGPDTTQLTLQLDVWQTYGYDVKFGNCYLERGHMGIANEKNFQNYGRDYLTIPEGMDVGAEYTHVFHVTERLMSDGQYAFNSAVDILIACTVQLENPGTKEEPNLNTASGDKLQGLPSGAAFYAFETMAEWVTFLDAFKDKPWVTQGITSITIIPNLSRYGYSKVPVLAGGAVTYRIVADGGHDKRRDLGTWRNNATITEYLGDRYKHLNKFKTSPYMVAELTTYSGTPIILKPERWQSRSGTIVEKAALLPPNQRVVIYPEQYNGNANNPVDTRTADGKVDHFDDSGDYLDFFTMVGNFPTMALINNMSIGYLASNAHGLAFQNASAEWAQQRALAGNQTSFDQQSGAIATGNELARLTNNSAITANTIAQDAMTAGRGAMAMGQVGNALLSPSPVGLGAASLGIVQQQLQMAIDKNAQNAGLANSVGTSYASTAAGASQAGMVRDTNKELADWASKGDYANNIAAINAKVQDARLTQPSISGQSGGEAFNLIHNASEWSLRVKMIGTNELRSIGEYWLRYGYAIRQFVVPPEDMMVMDNFTYWKMSETYLIATKIPESFKQIIRGIFEKGVTVWADPAKIGTIDIANNTPKAGITL